MFYSDRRYRGVTGARSQPGQRWPPREVVTETPSAAIAATHPTAASRLARMRGRLPLAERIYYYVPAP
jgi:hypothetical protein